MNSKKKATNWSAFLPIIKACAAAIAITIVLILLLALALKTGLIEYGAVPVANQVIKVLGIILASMFATQSVSEKPWMRGMISGLVYIVLGFIVFSIVSGAFSFSVAILFDLIMGAVIGVLAALVLGKKAKAH